MSVTFSITGNRDYCQDNGLVIWDSYECQCVDERAGNFPDPCCLDCKGTGKMAFQRCPFELNLANGNAMAVIRMLKMEEDWCGSCDPQVVLDGIAFVRSLQGAGVDPLVSQPSRSGGHGQAEIISCGRSHDQVERYLVELEKIAREAQRREDVVVWG